MLTLTTTKPGDKYRSIKNPRVYEALRRKRMSKRRAAMISNAMVSQKAVEITTKPMTRSEAARVAALARWGKYTPRPDAPVARGIALSKQPKPVQHATPKLPRAARRAGGKKGRAAAKPKKTEQQRAEEQQAKREQREQERQAQREANRAQVYERMGIGPDGRAALEALRRGEQPDPQAIARGGFVDAGLVEQAADGSYRMTPAGRALTGAADSGDAGRAGDTISGARDRLSARRARREAAEERKRVTDERKRAAAAQRVARGSGGNRRAPRRADDRQAAAAQRRMARIRKRLADAFARARQRTAQKSFTVFKDHTGADRWLSHTTTAYRDRDGEILSTRGLDANARRMTATGQYGPLRYWHIGQPDPTNADAPWGQGLDIGDCDFSMLIGRTLVESGTFRTPQIAEKMAAQADQHEMSPGFFHDESQPDADRAFDDYFIFERSTVPVDYARASNLFTRFSVKEQHMDPKEFEKRLKVAQQKLGLSDQQTESERASLIQTDKAAAARRVAYKSSDDAPKVYELADGTLGTVIDGHLIVLKEMLPEAESEVKADDAEVDAEDAGMIGDESASDMMDDAAFIKAIAQATAQAVVAELLPHLNITDKVNELKSLMGGYAKTKDDAAAQADALRDQEAARLRDLIAQQQQAQADLQAKLKELTEGQPANQDPPTSADADVQAALKSSGPTQTQGEQAGGWSGIFERVAAGGPAAAFQQWQAQQPPQS